MPDSKNPFTRTVLGDILPSDMGLTYSHEHIIIEESFPTLSNPMFILNDVDKVSTELRDFYNAGGRTLVDTMPANCGRNIVKLAEVAKNSGTQIIAPTGIHLEKYYVPNHWRYSYSADQITSLFIDDITLGIDRFDYNGPFIERTAFKAGIIKLATGGNQITKHQEKIFEAGVNAHKATGAPIITHTDSGSLAMEQVSLFQKLGADLSHVVISHVDRIDNIDFQKELLETGVRLEYDASFRWKKDEENITYKLLGQLLPEFPDQITMGMDMAKNIYWKSYGGSPGITFLMKEFREVLRNMDMEEFFTNIFFTTPQQLFSFKPTI